MLDLLEDAAQAAQGAVLSHSHSSRAAAEEGRHLIRAAPFHHPKREELPLPRREP